MVRKSGVQSVSKKKKKEVAAPSPVVAVEVECQQVEQTGANEASPDTYVTVKTKPVVKEEEVDESRSDDTQDNHVYPVHPRQDRSDRDSFLQVNLSRELVQKIKNQSAEEGISVNEYVSELLAEGVVLRAWEIVEKKAQMRGVGGNQSQVNANHNHRNNNHRGGGRNDRFNNNRRGNMSSNRYNSIMDDKASFLEYVRNQERQGR